MFARQRSNKRVKECRLRQHVTYSATVGFSKTSDPIKVLELVVEPAESNLLAARIEVDHQHHEELNLTNPCFALGGRRILANRLLEQGQSIETVQTLLRHSELDHVMPYIDRNPTRARTARDTAADAFLPMPATPKESGSVTVKA